MNLPVGGTLEFLFLWEAKEICNQMYMSDFSKADFNELRHDKNHSRGKNVGSERSKRRVGSLKTRALTSSSCPYSNKMETW